MALKSHKNKYRLNEPEEVNLDDWMNTYGDMITLLMAFFLMLISISKVDMSLWEQMKSGIISEIKDEKIKTPLADIKRALDSLLADEKAAQQVNIKQDQKNIMLKFASSAFYAGGSADISPTAQNLIDKVSQAIKQVDYYPFVVDVEGHTDDVPINTIRFPSNWELSVSRATNIVKYMIETGVNGDRLKAAGYADTKPVAPNRDSNGKPIPENQAANRRIVIRIH